MIKINQKRERERKVREEGLRRTVYCVLSTEDCTRKGQADGKRKEWHGDGDQEGRSRPQHNESEESSEERPTDRCQSGPSVTKKTTVGEANTTKMEGGTEPANNQSVHSSPGDPHSRQKRVTNKHKVYVHI